MSRTGYLKLAALAAVAALSAFALPAAEAQTTLRVVMHSDLKILDPIWTTAYITRNHGYMIYDTLFATDANGKVEEVRGDGVMGEQPYLKPGQGFRYSSGAVIETPVGSMHGSYQMLADDGAHFDAPIQPFRLAMPGILQ
jgi:uncharacterized protein affecting Mg2+/Co2+ transport